MKITFTKWPILFLFFTPLFLHAQTDTSKFDIWDLTLESGVFFPRSDGFKDLYHTSSSFNWSIGMQFGTSKSDFLPWIKFGQYRSDIDSTLTVDDESFNALTARRIQVAVGLNHPVRLPDNNFLQLKTGVSFNLVSEFSTDQQEEAVGFIMAVGYMRRISRNITYYLDFNYDYLKTEDSLFFNDWGGFLINMGIGINLMGKPKK